MIDPSVWEITVWFVPKTYFNTFRKKDPSVWFLTVDKIVHVEKLGGSRHRAENDPNNLVPSSVIDISSTGSVYIETKSLMYIYKTYDWFDKLSVEKETKSIFCSLPKKGALKWKLIHSSESIANCASELINL